MARSVNENGLTEQQEMFVNAYMREGCGCASEAYRVAYPLSKEWAKNSLHVEASKMLTNTKVIQRMRELRRNAAGQSSLSLAQAKQILTGLANTVIRTQDDVKTVGPVVIKSIERLARLEQWDAPEQIQVEQVSFNLNLAPEPQREPTEEREPRESHALPEQVLSTSEANGEEMPG